MCGRETASPRRVRRQPLRVSSTSVERSSTPLARGRGSSRRRFVRDDCRGPRPERERTKLALVCPHVEDARMPVVSRVSRACEHPRRRQASPPGSPEHRRAPRRCPRRVNGRFAVGRGQALEGTIARPVLDRAVRGRLNVRGWRPAGAGRRAPDRGDADAGATHVRECRSHYLLRLEDGAPVRCGEWRHGPARLTCRRDAHEHNPSRLARLARPALYADLLRLRHRRPTAGAPRRAPARGLSHAADRCRWLE